MASLTFPTLSPGAELVGYRVLEAREPGTYDAQAADGTHVVLSALSDAEATSCKARLCAPRDHLVHALGTVEAEGARWLVTEALSGASLAADFERARRAGESLDSTENVRTLLRLADVVAHLHADGHWHGRIRPESVLVSSSAPPGKALEAPVLLFGEYAEPPYRSPERSADAAGSLDDDTWAVAAIAFELLTGRPCPESGFSSEDELAEQGVVEGTLRGALQAALGVGITARREALRPLRRALARHFVHRADDGSVPAGAHTINPPPLPGLASARTPAPGGADTAPPAKGKSVPVATERRRLPALAIAGLVVGLGVAWALKAPLSSSGGTSTEVAAAHPSPSAAAPLPSGATNGKGTAISINDVAVTADQKNATGNELATCVAGWLPKGGGLENPGELSWVCTEADAAGGAAKLSTRARLGSEMALALKAMGPLAQVAFAAVQKGCCESPATLSSSDARCSALGPALATAGKAVVDGEAVGSAVTAASEALGCAGAPPPSEVERKAFQAYVDAIRRE